MIAFGCLVTLLEATPHLRRLGLQQFNSNFLVIRLVIILTLGVWLSSLAGLGIPSRYRLGWLAE